jgi:hypothetical protein
MILVVVLGVWVVGCPFAVIALAALAALRRADESWAMLELGGVPRPSGRVDEGACRPGRRRAAAARGVYSSWPKPRARAASSRCSITRSTNP